MSLQLHSHKRKNLLTGEWVLVSPHRTQRPWQGEVGQTESGGSPAYDPACYLCPGNTRVNGDVNPAYVGGFAFDNDFAALSSESEVPPSGNPMFQHAAERGHCRVVAFSDRHDLRLATMDEQGVADALAYLFREFTVLDQQPDIGYVQVFENRGSMMGCSNPHPHAQIWATGGLPNEPAKELRAQSAHYRAHEKPLLLDYLAAEEADGARVVALNQDAISLVPYWAVWPYETLLMPRRAVAEPGVLSASEVLSFAQVLSKTLRAYENFFSASVPYSMGFHPRPSDGKPHPEWQFHLHIYPPLLRSATVKKYQVGFEMLGMPQRDLTPETAAERLRSAHENG